MIILYDYDDFEVDYALRASLDIFHLTSNARSWSNC